MKEESLMSGSIITLRTYYYHVSLLQILINMVGPLRKLALKCSVFNWYFSCFCSFFANTKSFPHCWWKKAKVLTFSSDFYDTWQIMSVIHLQVALVFPNNDPVMFMVAFYGCLLAELVPVPIEVPLTRKVRADMAVSWECIGINNEEH